MNNTTFKRLAFLFVYAVVINIVFYLLKSTSLPLLSAFILGILGYFLGRIIFPNQKVKKKEEK